MPKIRGFAVESSLRVRSRFVADCRYGFAESSLNVPLRFRYCVYSIIRDVLW